MIVGRRSFLAGIFAAGCGPAIVRASSLMPIKPIETTVLIHYRQQQLSMLEMRDFLMPGLGKMTLQLFAQERLAA